MNQFLRCCANKVIAIMFFLINGIMVKASDTLNVEGPSGNINVKVWVDKQLYYEVYYKNKQVMTASAIDMMLQNGQALSVDSKIKSFSYKKVSEEIVSPVPEKRKLIPDVYNQLTVNFRKPFKVEFRVYDDGLAYRISTAFKDSIVIKDEVADFCFPGRPSAYFPEIPYRNGEDMFHTTFEDTYNYKKVDSFPATSIAYSPVLIVPEAGPKIAITESDLEEYPGMFVKGTGSSSLKAVFAGYPIEEKVREGLPSQVMVAKRRDYIARTKGARSFPWRVLIIAEEDKQLPSIDIVYRLASPSRIGDVSWIKPGNVTEEWINDLNFFNVPFKSGINTASYKYYIDFAHRFGIDMIMMDAGWSDYEDLFKVVPEISMDTLIAYAKEKGVKIAMWTSAMTLDRQLDSALDQFNKWGVGFIMTDFIDRDDQKAVNFHHRIARACADHKIMIMFHGSFPPKGFNRTYPNAVAREAVLGSEYNIWTDKISPGHDVTLPFTRMLAGSLDYEPGLLSNATKKSFHAAGGYVMGPGTRCHQLAMYVVYDSPIQFFSGNPSQGFLEPEFMELLGSIPTTWDETIILDARIAAFIVTARKKDNEWYVGGMTDWTARDIEINFDFLDNGEYEATICKDGINAHRYAADYVIEKLPVNKSDKIKIHLSEGGGFLIKLKKKS